MKLLVVGGGPAGVTAALQARELGADVTLLEAEQIGGTNLNHGPAPVRTLARAARLARDWSSWERFGLEGPPPVPNLEAVLANAARVARYAHDKKDVAGHLRHQGIDLDEHLGPVQFTGPHTVRAGDGRTWRADRIVIAVGCRAAPLPVPGGELALTYQDIWTLKALPHQRHDHRRGGHRLPDGLDLRRPRGRCPAHRGRSPARSRRRRQHFHGTGPGVRGQRHRAHHRREGPGPGTQRRAGQSIGFTRGGPAEHATTEAVFAAVGWPASLHNLDLDAAAVTSGPRAIPVDDYLQTNAGHIFAAGDVNGRSKLVQSARLEGRIAAWNAVHGPTRQPGHDVVATGSFTDPEYGSVGMTEAQAAHDHDVAVGIARYDDLVRPVADGHPDGFCKLIADRHSHVILGAHVLGEYSAETARRRPHAGHREGLRLPDRRDRRAADPRRPGHGRGHRADQALSDGSTGCARCRHARQHDATTRPPITVAAGKADQLGRGRG